MFVPPARKFLPYFPTALKWVLWHYKVKPVFICHRQSNFLILQMWATIDCKLRILILRKQVISKAHGRSKARDVQRDALLQTRYN